jgi:hypothetical protein
MNLPVDFQIPELINNALGFKKNPLLPNEGSILE